MSDYAFYFLNTKQKKLFKLFRDALFRHTKFIPIPEIDANEISIILKAVLTDTPDIFWFEGKWEYAVIGSSLCIHPLYTIASSDSLIIQGQVDETCSDILSLVDSSSEILRIRYAYDWILSNVEYGFEDGRGQTIYDVLIKRKAVCKGLSKGLQFLLKQMNLFSTLQEGTIDDKSKHVWNIVEIDNAYFNVDVSMGYDYFSYLFEDERKNDKYRCFAVPNAKLSNYHRIKHLPWPSLI